MYNRYIPQDGYARVEHGGHNHAEPDREAQHASPLSFLSSLFGGGGKKDGEKSPGFLSGILDKFGLDRGDILLLLVLIYLFRETDDDEWLIILALVLLMGL